MLVVYQETKEEDKKEDEGDNSNLLPPLEEWPRSFQEAIRNLSDKDTDNPSEDIINAIESLYNATSFGNVHHKLKEDWELSSSSIGGGILKDLVGKLFKLG